MSKLRLQLAVILVLAALGLLALAFKLNVIPERYDVQRNLGTVTAFWNDEEIFIFASHTALGHRHSWLTDHAPPLLRLFLMQNGLEEVRHLGAFTTAFRVAPGQGDRFDLAQAPTMPAWDLEDGRLVARPAYEDDVTGFAWDGSSFARVSRPPAAATAPRQLGPEDQEEPDGTEYDASLSSATRAKLKAAGWHFRRLSAYEAVDQPLELPMRLADSTDTLMLEAAMPQDAEMLSGMNVALTLSVAGEASGRTLFASEGRTSVSRAEFERLAAAASQAPEAEQPSSGQLSGYLVWIVGGALTVWLLLKGPTRGVKIGLLVFVAMWGLWFAWSAGPSGAAQVVVVPIAVGLGTMVASTRWVSYSVKRSLLPVGEDACPSYARRRVEELTAAFEQLGFRCSGDRQATWRMMGAERKTFIRFFCHEQRHTWVEVQAMDSPRAVGRMLVSLKGETRVMTCDLQPNQELLREPRTVTQRVARSSHCGEMVAAHDALVATTGGTLGVIDDPVATSVAAHDQWVEALRRLHQIDVKGERFKVSYRAAIPVTLRVIAAWFH